MFLEQYTETQKWFGIIDTVVDWITIKAGAILIAIIFLLISFRLLKIFIKFLQKSIEKTNIDKSVALFVISFINIGLKVILCITAATIVGFEVTSFITIIGSAGIAIGLALQGSLANIAGGVLILVLKPFEIGDYIIQTGGSEGVVVAIDIFYTKLRTNDNKIISIPNGSISSSSITNVTNQNKRRLDLTIGISYSDDIRTAKEVLNNVISVQEYVLPEEFLNIFVSELSGSEITLGIQIWVATENYFLARGDLLEKIKYAFDENNITIPYGQIDVNLKQQKINLSK